MRTAKLSRLQRAVLAMAADGRRRHLATCTEDHADPRRTEVATAALSAGLATRQCNGVDLYYAEVLADLFGFPHRCDRYPHLGCDLHRPGQHFSREEVGPHTYDAAQASLSRAVRRLEERGLVTVYCAVVSRWTGLSLTDEAVRTVADLPQSQPFVRSGETASTPADRRESEQLLDPASEGTA